MPHHGKEQIAQSLAELDQQKVRFAEIEVAATSMHVSPSSPQLSTVQSASIDHTTDIRLQAGDREAQRRVAEEKRRQDRLWRLQEEAVASNKANAAVEMKWSDLKYHNMPQELNEVCFVVFSAFHIFASVLRRSSRSSAVPVPGSQLPKTSSSGSLWYVPNGGTNCRTPHLTVFTQAEIKSKDEEYILTIASQARDVEELITRMNAQYQEMQAAYDAQLGSIEEAYAKEHSELVAAHRAELDELFELRKRMERTLVEERLTREAAYQQELDAMQAKDAEQYNKLKIKLETDVQVLEQQLELMRSTYTLNIEKLEYNFRVLSEKDTENEIAEGQQKEKIKELDRALTKVMAQYVAADRAFKAENTALTREYRRITRQYQDLQAKFGHFEAADRSKFRQVWAMHEEEVSSMLQRALAADRVVTEQLLGWEWKPPKQELTRPAAALESRGAPAALAAAAAEARAAGGHGSGDEGGSTPPASSAGGGSRGGTAETQGSHVAWADAAGDDGDMGGAGGAPEGEGTSAPPPRPDSRLGRRRNARVQVVSSLLVQEASFLVDEDTAQAAAEAGDSEALITGILAEGILQAVGCETDDDVEELVQLFFTPRTAAGGAGGPSTEEEDADAAAEGEATAEGALATARAQCTVPPGDVVRTVLRFVESKESAKREAAAVSDPFGTKGGAAGGGGKGVSQDVLQLLRNAQGGAGGSAAAAAGGSSSHGDDAFKAEAGLAEIEESLTEVEAAQKEEAAYWQRLVDTVPPRTVRVWQVLEQALLKYVSVLQQRTKAMSEVSQLKAQNAELKGLLQQYLGAKVNQELQVPPTQTIRGPTGGGSTLTRSGRPEGKK